MDLISRSDTLRALHDIWDSRSAADCRSAPGQKHRYDWLIDLVAVSRQRQLAAHLCVVWLQSGGAQAVSDGLCVLPQGLPRGRPVRMQHSGKGDARGMLQLQRLAVVLYSLLRLGGL